MYCVLRSNIALESFTVLNECQDSCDPVQTMKQ